MAIIAYTGLPGSGKSYGVVENVIIPAIKANRRIITNVVLRHEVLIADFPEVQIEYVGEELKDLAWWKRTELSGAIVILDELWKIWPSGLKVNDAAEEHKSFLAEHRHMVGDDGLATEICIISQDLSQIAAWVRVLVEATYRSVKLTAVGAEKKFRIDIYNGAQTGQNPPESARIRQIFGQYKESVYKYYVSHTRSLSGSVGTEKRADQRANILKSWTILVGLPGSILAVIFSVWYMIGWFKNPAMANTKEVNTVVVQDTQQMDGNIRIVGPQPKPKPALSQEWRVAGQIDEWIIITGIEGYFRRIKASHKDCKENQLGEWICELEGQLITEYSGPRDRLINKINPFTQTTKE